MEPEHGTQKIPCCVNKDDIHSDVRKGTIMQPSFILFGIVTGGSLLIQVVAFVLYRWRNSWRYRKRVVASIKQVQIWLDGWYVAAVWTDALTGQCHTFHSHRIESGFKQRVGENIIVDVDPNNFEHYRMLL